LLISPTTNPSTNNSNFNSPVLHVTDESLSNKYSNKDQSLQQSQPSSTAVGNNEESKSKKKSRFTVKAVPVEVNFFLLLFFSFYFVSIVCVVSLSA
jgi:hypothetical protein